MQKTLFSSCLTSAREKRVLSVLLAVILMFTIIPGLPAYADEGDVIEVSTGAELDDALQNATDGSKVKLLSDIDAVSSATYAGKTITIDGNGYTIDGQGVEKTTIRFTGTSNITLKNVTIKNCIGNIRYGGGGFAIFRGTLNVENSSFIGNSSLQGDGGGILIDGGGGNITNCTFYGNSAAGNGGAISSAGITTITNCTIVANSANTNGGGAFNNARNADQTTTIYNSIIIGNSATAGTDVYKFADGGANILGGVENASETSDSTLYNVSDTSGWLASTPQANGCAIPTIALLESETSPAVDAANAAYAPVTDQRGMERYGDPDIGSYELVKAEEIISGLKMSTDAHLVTNGSYANLLTEFVEPVNSNTAILRYTFDTALFNFADFHPADGVTIISKEGTEDGAKVVVMVPNYDTMIYGTIAIYAKADALLTNGKALVNVSVDYVVKDAADVKEIQNATASTSFTTRGNGTGEPENIGDTNADGVVDLLDLSNMIDWFGFTDVDTAWDDLYVFFDFNNSGDIDIYDIAYVARLI